MQVAVALGETVIKLEEKFLIWFWHPVCLRSCLLRKWYRITNVPAFSLLAIVLIIGSSPSCRPQLLRQEAVERWQRTMGVMPEASQAASDLQCCKSLSHPESLQIQISHENLVGLIPSACWDEDTRADAIGEVRVFLPKYSYSWFGAAADFYSVRATDLLPNALATSK